MHHQDESARRQWQNPEAILREIGLKSGMTIADIGCGYGFFTIPAARLAGESGKVYGTDINPEGLDMIRRKARTVGLQNITLQAGKAEEIILCHQCLDIAFFGIVLHDLADPLKVLRNARVMLKPAGKLVNLDWKQKPMEIGPPQKIRFSEAKAQDLIESAGFKVTSVTASGEFHYIITAVSYRITS